MTCRPRFSRPVELGFLVMLVCLASHRVGDPDLWTHLASGRWMLEHGAFLDTNRFSFVCPDHPWANVYWLYQLILVGLWNLGGAPALAALKVALTLGLGGLVLWGLRDTRQPVGGGEALALFLGGWLLVPRLTDRPELISFVAFAGLLTLLRRGRWWACLPLQVVWANTHGFYLLGPLAAALYAVSEAVHGRRPPARAAGLTALALLLVSMVSPLGWNNLGTLAGARGTLRALGGAIEETISPFHPLLRDTDALTMVLVLFILLIAGLFWWKRRAIEVMDVGLVLLTLPAALLVRRSVPLLVIAAWPGLLRAARNLEAPRLRWAVAAVMLLLGIDFAAGGGGRLVRFTGNQRVGGWGLATETLPGGAAAFLQADAAATPLRVLNIGFHSGGYLNWILHEPGQVMIDGRMEAYPRAFVLDYLTWQTDPDRLAAAARAHAITHLLVVTDGAEPTRLARRLQDDPRWETCYLDPTAVVFRPRWGQANGHPIR